MTPGLVPCCETPDFQRDGTCTAITRLFHWMISLPEQVFPLVEDIKLLPRWIFLSDMELACDSLLREADRALAVELIRQMRVARVQIDNFAEGHPPSLQASTSLPMAPDIALCATMSLTDARVMAATVRLTFGELIEAAARARALELCSTTELPSPGNKSLRTQLARVFADSYAVAVWTTSHAEYLMHLSDLMATMPSHCTSYDVQPPSPSPLLVPWALCSLPDLSVLLDRRQGASGGGGKGGNGKQANAMAQLLWRCTNAGSRGWDSVLSEAVKDGEGCARICRLSLLCTLTGLHPNIHPASRPVWETRSKIYHIVMATTDSKRLVCASPSASKEATRLYLAAILHQMPATREALLAASHPAGNLLVAAVDLPLPAMVAAMTSLADAGTALLRTQDVKVMLTTISDALSEEQKRPKRPVKRGSMVRCFMQSVTYNQSWLGRSQPSVPRATPLCEEVSAFSFAVFKADFIPLWFKSWTAGNRLSRLDSQQHATMSARNPVRQLVDAIPEERRLYIQRLALCTSNAALLGLDSVAELLGHTPPPPADRGQSSLTTVTDATLAAELVHFAKMASLGSNILAWDLGERTRAMQLRALCRRLMISDLGDNPSASEIKARLPLPTTHIMACVECRRVSNAFCDHTAKPIGFNEVGIASSMLRVDGELCDGHMRCAKRSSAALRTAMQLEEDAKQVMCNAEDAAPRSTALVPYDAAAMLTKLRRDQKAVFDQTGAAVSCGDQPLVHIPILGYVVRLFGTFYSLCSMCGCLCTVNATNRFLGDICCMHCDAEMLSRNHEQALADYRKAHAQAEPKRCCRFCGKPDTSSAATTKWKLINAPLDGIGRNKDVPYPLRTVTYCPAHYKTWLPAAHRELSTEDIFSHLSNKAKPIAGAQNGKRGLDDDPAVASAGRDGAAPVNGKPKKQRRVRMLKRKTSAA